MCGQRLEVVRIGGQDSASRFGMRHDQRVDSGVAPSASPEQGGPSGQRLGYSVSDVASLEKPVLTGVSTGVTFHAFHQDD
jgi:hypothetical protein